MQCLLKNVQCRIHKLYIRCNSGEVDTHTHTSVTVPLVTETPETGDIG